MTNPTELCERLRAIGGSSWGDGGWRVRCEAAGLIEAQAKQIAEQAEELQALIADNASMLESLTKEATARCDAEDRVAALEAKCALLAASLVQEEARSRAIEAAAIERCAKVCDAKVFALDNGGKPYRREATASQCAEAIRALLKTDGEKS